MNTPCILTSDEVIIQDTIKLVEMELSSLSIPQESVQDRVFARVMQYYREVAEKEVDEDLIRSKIDQSLHNLGYCLSIQDEPEIVDPPKISEPVKTTAVRAPVQQVAKLDYEVDKNPIKLKLPPPRKVNESTPIFEDMEEHPCACVCGDKGMAAILFFAIASLMLACFGSRWFSSSHEDNTSQLRETSIQSAHE